MPRIYKAAEHRAPAPSENKMARPVEETKQGNSSEAKAAKNKSKGKDEGGE